MKKEKDVPTFERCFHTIAMELGVVESYLYSILSYYIKNYRECFLTNEQLGSKMRVGRLSTVKSTEGKSSQVTNYKTLSPCKVSHMLSQLEKFGWINLIYTFNEKKNKKERLISLTSKLPVAEFKKSEFKSTKQKQPNTSTPKTETEYQRLANIVDGKNEFECSVCNNVYPRKQIRSHKTTRYIICDTCLAKTSQN